MRAQSRRTRWTDMPLALWLLAAPLNVAGAQAIADQLAYCKDEGAAAQARIEACTQVVVQAKDDDDLRAEALLQRGVLYEFGGDKDAALADYSEVIKLDPASAVAYFNRGNVHDQMGDRDRAIADYTEAVRLDPSDPDVFNNRGQAYDAKGEADLAIADYTQSIRLNRETRARSSIAALPMRTRANTTSPSPTSTRPSGSTLAMRRPM